MVRVAAISDIHGNLAALKAVLADVALAHPELIVVCGDVASGPWPVETIELLKSLQNARFLHGNADRGLVAAYDAAARPHHPGQAADWCAAQLSKEHRDFLASFPDEVRLDIDGLGRVLFCHGSPRGDEEVMTAASSEERMRDMVEGSAADVVVCGHTHMQFLRSVGGVRVTNPGSVGMPYGEPGAYWAMLGPDIEFQRTDYDRVAAAVQIRKSSWPDAAEFARDNVLTVPGVDEVMEYLRKIGGP